MEELENSYQEALDAIDDMVNVIGEEIINIAYDNKEFICTRCLSTAGALYRLLRKYAREEDANDILEQFQHITGRNLDDE